MDDIEVSKEIGLSALLFHRGHFHFLG